MKHQVSRELHAYWDRLRGGRSAPERSDLDPSAIRSILADTFLADVTGGIAGLNHDLVIRLPGTRLSALFMNELRGRSLQSIWRGDHRAAFAEMLDGVLDEQMPVVAGVHAAPREVQPVDLELLLLPLRHHGKTHARVLGSLTPSHVPTWLGCHPIEELTLNSFRTIARNPAPRLPGPATAFRGQRPVTYGRFTVYEGGR